MRHRAIVLLAGLVAAGIAAAQTPVLPYPPVPESIEGAKTYIYKDHGKFKLPLFLFSPPGEPDPDRPAVVFFHGSGWTAGTVLQFVGYARHLAEHGIVAAVAEYRIKEGYNATPFDAVADAKSAVRWLRSNSSMLKVDPDRIVAAGGSAGAHIALAAGQFEGQFDDPRDDLKVSGRPDALILIVPIVDTTETGYKELIPLFEGRHLSLSPIHHLRGGLPPMQILYGAADPYVPAELVERFGKAARQHNNHVELVPFEGRSHFFYNHPSYFKLRPHMKDLYPGYDFVTMLHLMERFLYERGFKKTEPTVTVVPAG